MLFLYGLGIRFYGFFIFLFSFFNKKASLWIKGRKNWKKNLSDKFEQNQRPVWWLHASSLGEYEQGRPLLQQLKNYAKRRKEKPLFLVTFFSPSGFEVRQHDELIDEAFYLPLDTPQNAKYFLEIVKPKAVFWVKYDFWFYFLMEIQKRKIPIILFSALFRPQYFIFQAYGIAFRQVLKNFTEIFVQEDDSVELLEKFGFYNVESVGDTRFDRVTETAHNTHTIPSIEKFKGTDKLLVIGSCWERDLNILIPFLNQFKHPLKVVIAPHEIYEHTLLRLEKELEKKPIRYSKIDYNTIEQENIILLDNVGMLAMVYQYADFSYVGGAFGEGLHNILEPATFGVPIFFGEDFEEFPEAVDLVEDMGAFSVGTTNELDVVFDRLYLDEQKRQEVGNICKKYVEKHLGGTQKIFNAVKRILEKEK